MKIKNLIQYFGIFLFIFGLDSVFGANPTTFFYTFGMQNGGAGALSVSLTGKIISHQIIVDAGLNEPKKLAASADGQRLVITSAEDNSAWIYRLGDAPQLLATIPLGAETGDVQPLGNHALLAAGKGFFYWIDLENGQVEKQWNSRAGLKPPGNKGEDILFLPEQNEALVSFQKDSKEGKYKGSRIVLLDLNTFTPKADLLLPREFPNLNLAQNKKEQGPNPEMLFTAPKSNALIFSLDLYGGIGFADLDSALRGTLKNVSYVPSAPTGAWGTAFPDRGLLCTIGGKDYLLVANASENGGIVLFDVAKRKVVQSFAVEAGAENPIFLPKESKVVTVISGKSKKRAESGLAKEFSPGNDLLVFDLAPLAQGASASLTRIPFDQPVVRVEAIDPDNSNLLLLALGADATEFVIYDLAARKEIIREPAKGSVNRIAVWRGSRLETSAATGY